MPVQGNYIDYDNYRPNDPDNFNDVTLNKSPGGDVILPPKVDVTQNIQNPTNLTLTPNARQAADPNFTVKKDDDKDNYFQTINQLHELYINRPVNRTKIPGFYNVIGRPSKELEDFMKTDSSKSEKIMNSINKAFDAVWQKAASEIPIQENLDKLIDKIKF